MGLDDFFERQVGIAVAATAALTSPRARAVMRRGAIYGVAGVLKAGDMVGSAVRGVATGVRGREADEEGSASEAPPAEKRSARARAPRRATQAQT